jgi:formate-dependent nitrite reductase membrane component NrfD
LSYYSQVGGALYTLGGYYLPFVVLGSALFTCAVMTLLVLPVRQEDRGESSNQGTLLEVLKIPGIQVCALGIIATSASIGFISATLEPHLRQFNLTAIFLGVMFVINGGVYAISAPFVGFFIDKCKTPKIASIFGSIFVIIGFSLIGECKKIKMT